MVTGFFWDETTFWHSAGNYADILPVGGLVQPMVAGGLPETPDSKRRFKNLLEVTGLATELHMSGAAAATSAELLRVHPDSYLDTFKTLSDAGGGELPFHLLNDAEIGHFYCHRPFVVMAEHVAWLQVAVDYPLVVEIT